jgi:redox-sensitive bicupin YhaK (pirin superfamily)
MMKKIQAVQTAQPSKVGPIDIVRALPNVKTQAVGPVIFLDHIPDKLFSPGELPEPDGSFAHPHRGIATFSYILKGEIVHYDSNGGKGSVKAGGVQWMNSGNGIIHDEMFPSHLRDNGGEFYAFQFWVNLPAKNKAEKPQYMPAQIDDLPTIQFPNENGSLKILLGEFEGEVSPIPAFSQQFIWHIKINAGAVIELPTVEGHEYGGYLPDKKIRVSNIDIDARQFFMLTDKGNGIMLENQEQDAIDIFIFGGEPYLEPVVSSGPFVMNSTDEIHQAYADYQSGNYGQINYE